MDNTRDFYSLTLGSIPSGGANKTYKGGDGMDLKKFQEFINRDEPVLVDFYAEWCNPCKMLKPIVEEVNEDYPVLFIDIDVNKDIAEHYNVMGVPLLTVFKNGEELQSHKGFAPKVLIESMLESAK